MNCISLDTVGIAGFAHDFGALEGRHSDVEVLFDSFGSAPVGAGLSILLPLLAPVLPFLANIPTKRSRLVKKLHSSMEEVSEELLARSRKEKEAGDTGGSSRSIIGALRESQIVNYDPLLNRAQVKAENADSELALTPDEVLSQVMLHH